MNRTTEAELHTASFLDVDEAHAYGGYKVREAEWSNPRMWHTYRIETEE